MSSVTERHRAAGLWEIMFRDLPQEYVDQLDELGHIAVTVAREDGPLGDHLLDSARYVGVVRFRRKAGGGDYDFQLRGAGMAWWLGTEDKTGDVIENPTAFAAAELDDVVRTLLPDSLAEGTLDSTGLPTFTHTYTYVSRREALDYLCDTVGAEWRVRGGGLVDAGPKATLYGDPKAVIVRRTADAGDDFDLTAYPGPAKTDRDIEDYTTRVVVLGKAEEATVVSGSAELAPEAIPYRDLFGNPVKFTRLVNESSTEGQNATARAQAQLNEQSKPQTAVTLDTGNYDLRGRIEVGADVWVYDPEAGLQDPANEITFRGQRLNPAREQVTAMTWPITAQMGVYYRSRTGAWLDVSRWVDPIDGQTTIEVGKPAKGLTSFGGGAVSTVGRVPEADTSVPNSPVFQTTFPMSTTQSSAGTTRVQVTARWFDVTQNTDSSAFVDGSHYELRWRSVGPASTRWSQAAAYTWGALNTWGDPIPLSETGAWSVQYAPIDDPQTVIVDLDPLTKYQFQVRAVDSANPPNVSTWSATKVISTPSDAQPPSVPAAALVAGSPVSIQVRHFLGTDQGGTYNLERDIRVLEVHASTVGAGFTPDDSTKLGQLTATYAMLLAQVPAIGTFPVPTTAQLWVKVIAVDEFGNRSDPSAAAAVTAELISDQYVSNISATKIIAGEFSAAYAVTGLMISGNETGARWESGTRGSLTGGRTYRPSGTLALSMDASTGDLITYRPDGTTRTFRVEADTGNVYLYGSDGATPRLQLTASTGLLTMVGKVVTSASGDRIEMDPIGPDGNSTISFFTEGGLFGPARLNAFAVDGTRTGLGINSGPSASGSSSTASRVVLWPTFAQFEVMGPGQVLSGGKLLITADGYAGLFHSQSPSGIELFGSGQVIIQGSGDQRLLMQSDGQITTLRQNTNNRVTLTSGGSGVQLVSAGTVKSFVVDHPTDPDRWLVHGCTESPTAGVEYAGTAIVEDHLAFVELPPYFEALCESDGRTVHLTPELATSEGMALVPSAAPSRVADGRFHIVCPAPDGTRVHWLVKATRRGAPFTVEPLRADVDVHGDGPYRYIHPSP